MIVNSRPISVESLTDANVTPLTPNHILTMKPKIVPPPPVKFERQDEFCRKRWRTVQLLADRFWSRWRKEYLSGLQKPQKWIKVERNFEEGDIVLPKKEALERAKWPIDRTIKAIKGKKGLFVLSK